MQQQDFKSQCSALCPSYLFPSLHALNGPPWLISSWSPVCSSGYCCYEMKTHSAFFYISVANLFKVYVWLIKCKCPNVYIQDD